MDARERGEEDGGLGEVREGLTMPENKEDGGGAVRLRQRVEAAWQRSGLGFQGKIVEEVVGYLWRGSGPRILP